MKATTTALLMAMMAGSAPAQTAPPSQMVVPVRQALSTAAKPAAKPAVHKAAAMPMRRSPMQAKSARPTAAAVKTAAKQVPVPPAGRRDPFVSPVVEKTGMGGPACETGKKCLPVGAMVLRGIVRMQPSNANPSGMIAVVENARRNTYFLHENDPVFNGYVVKITTDSVTLRENVIDAAGRQSTRDVVKKMSAPAV